MAKRRFTKAEKKQIRKEQRQKDALRSYRFRPLKNFFIWLTGVVSCLVILVSALFVGFKFVPISTFTGGNTGEIFSEDISSKSIIDALLAYNTYDMSDFPIITNSIKDLAESEDVKKFVNINTEKLSNLKFDNKFADEFASCFEVTATLESVGAVQFLDNIGGLTIFTTWEEVEVEPEVDGENVIVSEEGKFKYNPHLYYYEVSETNYARAFDNSGKRVEQSLQSSKLYYPNLSQIPVLELTNVLADSFGRVEVSGLISLMGGALPSDSVLNKILDGKTMNDLNNFSEEEILLKDFNLAGDILSLLCSIIVPAEGEEITEATLNLKHLGNSMDFGRLLISDFDIEEEIISLLCSIIVPNNGEEINKDNLSFGHLMNNEISTSNLYLVDFLKGESETPEQHYENNKTLYDILCSAVKLGAGEQNYEKLTIQHLQNGLTFDNVKLVDILCQKNQTVLEHYNANKMLYDVLYSAVTDAPSSWQELTVGNLQGGLYFTKVPLSTLQLDNPTLDILLKAANASRTQGEPELKKEDLTISHITSNIFTYVCLTDVLPFEGGEDGNVQLYKILLQAAGITIEDPDDEDEIEEKALSLNINSLEKFDVDLVNLSTILPVSDNPNLYKILVDATGIPSGEIKIGDFARFKISDVKLNTFITQSDNKIIKALIKADCTVGAIGTKINSLKLYDIFGQTCFMPHDQNVNTPRYSFDEESRVYKLDSAGTYMINKKAGIWLFLCFDAGEIEDGTEFSNAIGCAKTYTISQATMGQLQNQKEQTGEELPPDFSEGEENLSGVNLSSKITSATIRQLVDAGILASANEGLYTIKLSVLANLSLTGGIPNLG